MVWHGQKLMEHGPEIKTYLAEADKCFQKISVMLEDSHSLQIQFRLNEDGRFKIVSKPRLAENDWRLHVTGRIFLKPYHDEIDDTLFENTQNELYHNTDRDSHYSLLKKVGLEYGAGYQTVKDVFVSTDKVKAHLENPNGKKRLFICSQCSGWCFSISNIGHSSGRGAEK